MFKALINKFKRDPDFIIIREEGKDYIKRWWVIPRNKIFNIYLHHFLGDDDARALHDHPWVNLSVLLSGSYIEHTPKGSFVRKAGGLILRKPTSLHRIELFKDSENKAIPVWTLFITGPVVRVWGFMCEKGWVDWKIFTHTDGNTSGVGKGCAD